MQFVTNKNHYGMWSIVYTVINSRPSRKSTSVSQKKHYTCHIESIFIYRILSFLKFYYSAKLPINSTYNVDEKFETEERANFSCALLSKLLTSQRKKEPKVTVNIFFSKKNLA